MKPLNSLKKSVALQRWLPVCATYSLTFSNLAHDLWEFLIEILPCNLVLTNSMQMDLELKHTLQLHDLHGHTFVFSWART